MSTNVPREYMTDPAPVGRIYPSSQRRRELPAVDANTNYVTHLAEGGYPDTSEAAQAFAAAQRQEARSTESRAAVTTGGAGPGSLIAPPGTGPAQPVQTVGGQPQNRR